MRKPRGPSERCGVSTTSSTVSSPGEFRLPPVMALQYMPFMPRRQTPSPAPKSETAAAKPRAKAKANSAAATAGAGRAALGPAAIHEIFRRFAQALPEPKGELEFVNDYTLLVAVVLSAQATDAGVNKATRALFAVADTPQQMLELGEEKLRDYIK